MFEVWEDTAICEYIVWMNVVLVLQETCFETAWERGWCEGIWNDNHGKDCNDHNCCILGNVHRHS